MYILCAGCPSPDLLRRPPSRDRATSSSSARSPRLALTRSARCTRHAAQEAGQQAQEGCRGQGKSIPCRRPVRLRCPGALTLVLPPVLCHPPSSLIPCNSASLAPHAARALATAHLNAWLLASVILHALHRFPATAALLRTRPFPPLPQTFGLKNKNKSSKVQKQVQIIQQQESQKGRNKELKEKEKEKQALQERKRAEQAKKELEASLYTGPEIVQPKVPFGVGAFRSRHRLSRNHQAEIASTPRKTDPKTVVCAYFKAGRCQKGFVYQTL